LKILKVYPKSHEDFFEITDLVKTFVTENRIKDGLVYLQTPGKTSAIVVAPNDDQKIKSQFLEKMNYLLPKYDGMQFTGWQTPALKASLTGQSISIMVEQGELILGLHQGIFYAEYGGPVDEGLIFMNYLGTQLAENEKPQLPEVLVSFYQRQQEKEDAEKAEQDRIIEEMRLEYKLRQAKEKEKEEKEEQENGKKEKEEK